MLCHYEEARILSSLEQDRDSAQRELTLLYHNGVLGARECVFDFSPLNRLTALCVIRAQKLPKHLNPTSVMVELNKGANLHFSLLLNAAQRKRVTGEKTRKTSYVTPDNIDEFVAKKLKQCGLSHVEMKAPIELVTLPISKSDEKFVLKVLPLTFEAQINEPEKLANALIEGVGRNRGFGLGMLKIINVG